LWNSGTTAVVFDLLSIKAPLLPSIRRGRSLGFHVGSIHPLFGPQVRSLTNRNLLIVDCGDRYANRRLRELFERSSVRVTTVPLAFHDRWMVDALALPHATSLMFGLAMQRGGRRPAPASEIAPTSFLRQSDAARVISHENPELSFDIQTLNPGTTSLFERMERSLRALRKAVRTENAGEYRRLMRAVAARIDGRTDDRRSTGSGQSRGAESQSPRRVAGPRTRRTQNRIREAAR
jgi:prephenate dehydrogenase